MLPRRVPAVRIEPGWSRDERPVAVPDILAEGVGGELVRTSYGIDRAENALFPSTAAGANVLNAEAQVRQGVSARWREEGRADAYYWDASRRREVQRRGAVADDHVGAIADEDGVP